MFILFILLFITIYIYNVNGNCTALSVKTPIDLLTTVCIDVVDYKFYLPSSTSLNTLNSYAQSKLNNEYLSILPNECKKSLKKLICSNIYLKCSTNNYNIFSDIGYPIPLPFERPCRSVCDDVNSECLGLLNLFGLEQNCSARYDYSYGSLQLNEYPYQYDQSNNNNYCNNVSSVFEVSSTKEPYIYAESNGACAGIISELYIPPSSAINSEFSPILPPYTIQTLIENQLASYVNLLPKWLGSECHFALRKYFCGSYMLKPQMKTFTSIIESFGIYADYVTFELIALGLNMTALANFNFYLPSYPSLQVCEDYSSKCGGFIELSGLAALVPNCSSKLSGISNYPNSTQTIITLPLEGFEVQLTTDPNKLEDSNDNNYEPRCPTGFVIPEDPDNSLVTYVPDSTSACAISCKFPFFTLSEYSRFIRVSDIGPNIGLPLVIIVLVVWILDETRRKQYLVIIFNAIALIVTIQCVYMSYIPFEKKFCSSNAVAITNKDGLTGCNIQSFFFIYFILAEALTWGLIAVDLYLKILTRVNTNKLWLYYLLIIFILPVISVAILAHKKQYGYYSATFCLTSNYAGNLDIAIFVLPIFIITIIGSLCMFAVIVKIIQSTKNVKVGIKPRIKSSAVVPSEQRPHSQQLELKQNNHSQSRDSITELNIRTIPVAPKNHDLTVTNAVDVLTSDEDRVITDDMKTSTNDNNSNLNNDSKKSRRKSVIQLNVPWKMIRTPVIFVTLYAGVWFSIFSLRFETYYSHNPIQNSFLDWAECVFTYYNGDDASWLNKCGKHPKVRPDVRLSLWVGFIVNSHALVVSLIFLLNPTIWMSIYNSFIKFIPETTSFRYSSMKHSRKSDKKSDSIVTARKS